jgi:hypothetical protein
MTPDAQRIAIAEACGFRDVKHDEWEVVDIDAREVARCEALRGTLNGERERVPDYLHDLNAMHDAEELLNSDQRCDYWSLLDDIVGRPDHLFRLVHATAPERADAFLKTIGRWEDTPSNSTGLENRAQDNNR